MKTQLIHFFKCIFVITQLTDKLIQTLLSLLLITETKKHCFFSQESAEYSYHYEEKVEVEVEMEQRGTTCCISFFFFFYIKLHPFHPHQTVRADLGKTEDKKVLEIKCSF